MMVKHNGRMYRVLRVVDGGGTHPVVVREVGTQREQFMTKEAAALAGLAATRHFEMMAQREADALITRAMQR